MPSMSILLHAMMPRFWLLLGCIVGISGCAVTSADGARMQPKSAAFAAYVEAVFRRQNEIATELALALDDEDPESVRFRELEDAELALLTACRGLNQMALSQRDGERVRGLSALKRARQAPACETASSAAAALLRRARGAEAGPSR